MGEKSNSNGKTLPGAMPRSACVGLENLSPGETPGLHPD